MNPICSRLLISLDALMDTRSGVLFNMDPDATRRVMKSSYYAGRHIDDFPGFDMARFKTLYANRDKSVLRYSTVTNTAGIVHDFLQRVMNKNLNSPVDMDAEIHLNVWPYKLTENDKDTLIKALMSKLPMPSKILVVEYSNEYLNPLFVRNTYSTMVMYDFFEWLEVHSENKLIEKYPIPEVTVFAPAIVRFKDDTIPENLAEQFTNAMTVMQPFVNALFLPVDVFCSFLSQRPKPRTAPEDSGESEEDQEDGEEDASPVS